MRAKNKLFVLFYSLAFILFPGVIFAQNSSESKIFTSFQGEVNANNTNVRTDSTVNSKIICNLTKGSYVDVLWELYDWYKIRLPKAAPSFIKKSLAELIDEKTAKVLKDNVNVRLGPSEASSIIGKANKDEILNVFGEKVDWYKIEPVNNSFGWIHKKFVNKAVKLTAIQPTSNPMQGKNGLTNKPSSENKEIVIEGVINPYGKVFRRLATHKFIANDNRIFLLRGIKENLNALTYHKVKITGKLIDKADNQKIPVIEITKMEALD